MITPIKTERTSLAVVLSLLIVIFSLSAHATLYTFDYSDSGPIPQGGTTFSVEHTISGIESPITSIELTLTFNDNSSLTGNSSSGIQGSLILDPGGSNIHASFSPVATSSGTGTQRIYDVTFSSFNGSNPNVTWGLDLFDNSNTHVENSLVSWTLNITAVPEPVNAALMVFGAFAAGFYVVRRFKSAKAASDK